MKQKTFWIACVFFFCTWSWTGSLIAQLNPSDYPQRMERAEKAIRDLQEGVLIVRLDSHRKKIDALSEAIDKAPEGNLCKRLEVELAETIADKEKWNRRLVQAFSEKYTFSKYLVMYDSSSASLKEGMRAGIFLNDSLQLDPAIRLEDVPYLVVDWEEYTGQSAAGQRGLVLSDSDYRTLEKPFPFFTHAEKYAYFLFIPLGEDLGQADKWMERLERNLRRFAARVDASNPPPKSRR